MNSLRIDRKIAGATTLWILQFKNGSLNSSNKSVDLLIPSPEGKNSWMVADLKSLKIAKESLDLFRNFCDQANESHETRRDISQEGLDYSRKVGEGRNMVDEIVKYFYEIIKHLRLPPKDQAEGESSHEES